MKHTWVISGRDFDNGIANIWKCSNCGMFKAIDYDNSENLYPEYSNPDGTVIACGRRDHRQRIKQATRPRCEARENT